jgi:hypothetical protein
VFAVISSWLRPAVAWSEGRPAVCTVLLFVDFSMLD